MSRIGKAPIPGPDKVNVSLDGLTVTASPSRLTLTLSGLGMGALPIRDMTCFSLDQ